MLDLALATAGERFTLGELKPSPGAVLYLALEDGRRRLQRRITRLLPTFSETWPPKLTIATEWPRADQGGVADIESSITSTESPRLVIVDTLAQFRKVSSGKAQIYQDDYGAISDLQKLASRYNIAVAVVHHDRKSEAEDVFDTVSGSLGLTGAADTILIMNGRQARSRSMSGAGILRKPRRPCNSIRIAANGASSAPPPKSTDRRSATASSPHYAKPRRHSKLRKS